MKDWSYLMILLLLLPGVVIVGDAQWVKTSLTAYTNNVVCLAVRDSILYAGIEFAGVHRSTDEGSSWVQIFSGDPNAVVASGTAVFVATSSGMYVSADSGATWAVTNSLNAAKLSVCGAYLYAVAGGLFRSSDAGRDWISIGSEIPNGSVGNLAVDGTNLFAATPANGVYFSGDYGNTWVARNAGLADLRVSAIAALGQHVVVATLSDVFNSSDAGGHWKSIGKGLPVGSVVGLIALTDTGLVVVTSNGNYSGCFLSTDQGATWSPFMDGGLADLDVHDLAVIGKDYFAATLFGVWMRGPGTTRLVPAAPVPIAPQYGLTGMSPMVGLIWGPVPGAESYHVQVATDPGFASVVFEKSGITDVSTGSTALQYATTYYWRVAAVSAQKTSSWSGTQTFGTVSTPPPSTMWKQQSSPVSQNLRDVRFVDAMNGWAVGGAGTILHTGDGGDHWLAQNAGTSSDLSAISFADPETGMVVGTGGTILLTSDGGNTWRPGSGGGGVDILDVALLSKDTAVVVRSDSIIRTTDGGQRWPGIMSNPYYLTVCFLDRRLGWLGGGNEDFAPHYALPHSQFASSMTSGESWTQGASLTWGPIVRSMSFTDSLHGWGAGWYQDASPLLTTSGALAGTTDGGTTWNASFHLPTKGYLRKVQFTSPQKGVVVGNHSGYPVTSEPDYGLIYRTSDGGQTWRQDPINPTNNLYSVAFVNDDVGWVVGDGGLILHTTSTFSGVPQLPAPPAAVFPGEGALNVPLTVKLLWQGVPGADSYEVQVGDPDVGGNVSTFTITDTSLQLNVQAPASNYYWMVRAGNSVGWGAWSGYHTFQTQSSLASPPVLLYPPDGGTDIPNDFTISWNTVAGATVYGMQVTTDLSFTTTFVFNDFTLTGSSAQIHGLSPATLYFMHIRSGNAAGWGPWSGVRAFRTVSSSGTAEIPETYSLSQNYPNPFNSSTTFQVGLPVAGHVTLRVYSVLGQHVATVIDGTLPAGTHDLPWAPLNLASGVYFYRLRTGGFVQSKRLLLLR